MASLLFFPIPSGALLRILSNVIGITIVLINQRLFKRVLPEAKYNLIRNK